MRPWISSSSLRLPVALLAVAETFAVVFAVVGTVWLNRNGSSLEAPESLLTLLRAFTVATVLVLSQLSMGLYHFHQRLYFYEILVRVAVSLVLAAIALAALYFVIPVFSLSRIEATQTFALSFALIVVIRLYFFRHVDANVFKRRTLLFGKDDIEEVIGDLRRRADRRGFEFVGAIKSVDPDTSLWRQARDVRADEIVVAVEDRRGNLPLGELLDCVVNGISVIELPEFLERESGKVRTDLISPSSLIYSPGFRFSSAQQAIKRLFDLVFGSLVLLISWPLMLLVVAAIVVEDGFTAPKLYRQTRVGHRGREYQILKFRSMIENAESDSGAVWATENDSRVTLVGRIIRKFRLDELPQIFNVLRGEMSFVGPRPERPEFVQTLSSAIPFYNERHMVKPGITGWAQLRYPYGSTDEDALQKLQYDLFYIKNQSIVLDMFLILQTLEVVLFGKGAR